MFLRRLLEIHSKKCKTSPQHISDYGHIAKHGDRAEQTGPWANAPEPYTVRIK